MPNSLAHLLSVLLVNSTWNSKTFSSQNNSFVSFSIKRHKKWTNLQTFGFGIFSETKQPVQELGKSRLFGWNAEAEKLPERREESRGKRRTARQWSAQMTWSTCFAFFTVAIASPTFSRSFSSTSFRVFGPFFSMFVCCSLQQSEAFRGRNFVGRYAASLLFGRNNRFRKRRFETSRLRLLTLF